MQFNIIKSEEEREEKNLMDILLSCPRTLKIWPHQDVVLFKKKKKTEQEIGKGLSRKHNQIEEMNESKWEKKVTKRFTCCMCDRWSLKGRPSVSQLKEAQQIIATVHNH